MHVQRVLLPATRRESWTVLGEDGPVQPIERYLAYLRRAVLFEASERCCVHLCGRMASLSSVTGWARSPRDLDKLQAVPIKVGE